MSTASTSPANELRQKANDIKDNLVDMAGIAKGMASDTVTDIKERVSSRVQAGVDQAGKARDGLIDYVKENPAKSLLACLAVGALAGYLVSRRR